MWLVINRPHERLRLDSKTSLASSCSQDETGYGYGFEEECAGSAKSRLLEKITYRQGFSHWLSTSCTVQQQQQGYFSINRTIVNWIVSYVYLPSAQNPLTSA